MDLNKIREHRARMKFSNTRFSTREKQIEESGELISELEYPTSETNLRKEIFDNFVTLTALCDNRGIDIDELIEWGIGVNESR